jgi:hypothetical protein
MRSPPGPWAVQRNENQTVRSVGLSDPVCSGVNTTDTRPALWSFTVAATERVTGATNDRSVMTTSTVQPSTSVTGWPSGQVIVWVSLTVSPAGGHFGGAESAA